MSALFALDIDNTLIYSRKHPHPGWPCVEWIHEKEQAYMSPRTVALYCELCRYNTVALVTSRSIEQYERLQLPYDVGIVLTANGSDLFINGVRDVTWRNETDMLIEPWQDELNHRFETLITCKRYIRCKVVDNAYLFVYCSEGIDTEEESKTLTRETSLEVIASGKKLYMLPPPLNKGEAVKRLMVRLGCTHCIAAGDSTMDLPMLTAADVAIAPQGLKDMLHRNAILCPPEMVFPEYVLKTALELSKGTKKPIPGKYKSNCIWE